ncbi:MAG: GTP 3',8-cyclase MoaA [Eubacteriales bacterium]
MLDQYGRVIDYVRISITDRCNLRCIYCMPEEGVPSVPHDKILRYDEIVRVCEIFAKLGISKIKITGGEPLVRKGAPALIGDIRKIKGIEEVTLTTNGILLETLSEELVSSGITGINISLDTLDAMHFSEITRGGDVNKILKGIDSLLSISSIPIKINCVPNYISDSEVLGIAQLAKDKKIHVRFIELMPIGTGKELIEDDTFDQETRIRKILTEAYGNLREYSGNLGNGPSTYVEIPSFEGKIGFISAMSHKFCDKCNRVRLTAEGYLKTCLQYDVGEDLFALLRNRATDEEIEARILLAIERKPKGHEFLEHNTACSEQKSMSQIGG